MATNKYPVGQGVYFSGSLELSSVFGIVRARIVAPSLIYAPILLTKINDNTVAPTGSGIDWYSTPELENAVKYGYSVQVLEGYHWDKKAKIFSSFVTDLYKLRLTFNKTDPRNLIIKLLLNGLYGRLGLSPYLSTHSFKEIDKKLLQDITPLGDDQNIFTYSSPYNLNLTNSRRYENIIDTSLPLAIFTTAYARIYMSKFKIKYAEYLYYSDTDSLVSSCQLPKELVGSNIGQFKLEYRVKQGIFLAPKVYGLLLEDGTEIIRIKGSKIRPSIGDLLDILKTNKSLTLTQSL